MRFKHAANTGFVERIYPKAKVIQIAALNAWRRATSSPQCAPDRHKVNQGSASPQLDETYRILSALERASKHITVKVKHSVQIDYAQYQVINFANANHRSILIDNVAAGEIYLPASRHWARRHPYGGEPSVGRPNIDAPSVACSADKHVAHTGAVHGKRSSANHSSGKIAPCEMSY
jgi:hypothetical protein